MQASGELVKDGIIVKKPRDVGRLYTRNHFGETISGNKLRLDLIEGVFLLDEKKIRVRKNGEEINFEELVKISAEHIPYFEIKYLIFRDLRKRGNIVKLCDDKDGFDFCVYKQKNEKDTMEMCFLKAFSERDFFDIDETKKLVDTIIKKDDKLWYGIVDEEGDITYYDVTSLDIKGSVCENVFGEVDGFLTGSRVLIFEKTDDLFNKGFYGKPFGSGLQLSMIEALYLLEKKVVNIKDLKDGKKFSKKEFLSIVKRNQSDIDDLILVFRDLKKRGLIVKTGFKFGTHFRVYTDKPDMTHAEYLVHVVEQGFKSMWAEISRGVRLAHSVNKEIIFARIDNDEIDYIKLGRLKP
ncbi:MAG: tRNA-intron lyase [Candidatus Thermoplasmatota archaeon]|jgi:tRNA-intron endonuclease|nr:tRNA-intron lyase [Candidatus Thermoplasmatota archaeon]